MSGRSQRRLPCRRSRRPSRRCSIAVDEHHDVPMKSRSSSRSMVRSQSLSPLSAPSSTIRRFAGGRVGVGDTEPRVRQRDHPLPASAVPALVLSQIFSPVSASAATTPSRPLRRRRRRSRHGRRSAQRRRTRTMTGTEGVQPAAARRAAGSPPPDTPGQKITASVAPTPRTTTTAAATRIKNHSSGTPRARRSGSHRADPVAVEASQGSCAGGAIVWPVGGAGARERSGIRRRRRRRRPHRWPTGRPARRTSGARRPARARVSGSAGRPVGHGVRGRRRGGRGGAAALLSRLGVGGTRAAAPHRPGRRAAVDAAGASDSAPAPLARRRRGRRHDRALGHRQLRLLQHGRRDAQLAVQQPGHQRHPRRAADQEQPGQLVRRQPGRLDHRAGLGDPAPDQRPGRRLELVAGQVHGLLDAGHRHRRERRPGQHLLGAAHVVPELPPGPPLRQRRRFGQRGPGLRLGAGQRSCRGGRPARRRGPGRRGRRRRRTRPPRTAAARPGRSPRCGPRRRPACRRRSRTPPAPTRPVPAGAARRRNTGPPRPAPAPTRSAPASRPWPSASVSTARRRGPHAAG